MNGLFEELISEGKATKKDIQNYLDNVNGEVTLKNVFEALNVN